MASLSGVFNLQEFTNLGELAAGYRLYTYAPSTTTLKVVYTDAAGLIPHTYTSDGLGGQYIALDARGELPAPVFMSTGGYDIALKTPAGVTIWTRRAMAADDAVFTGLADSSDVTKGDALVAVKYPATGAVARTQHEKNMDFVSVADFGAVGDGTTDDTAAIQAALNACLSIDFGDQTKNYKVSGTLTVRSHSLLRGSGARLFQTVLQTPLFNCVSTTDVIFIGLEMTGVSMSVATAGAFVVGRQYSIITVGTTDFTLIGASSNTAGRFFTATGAGTGTGTASTFYNTPNSQDIGIKANAATRLTVTGCKFNNFAYAPLMVATWGTTIRFTGNVIVGPGEDVLNPLGLADPQTPGFRNCTAGTILGYDVLFADNTISDTSQGIYIGQQSRDVVVRGNKVLNTIVEHGMYCDAGCKHVQVVHNSFSDCKLIGAKVQWYDDITDIPFNIVIAHNSIDTAGGDGIIVLNAGQNTIATLTGVTQAAPGVFTTTSAHGLAVDDKIDIAGVVGMTPVNSAWRVASTPTSTTFTVKNPRGAVDTSGFPAYVSGGTVRRPVYGSSIVIANNTLKNIGQDAISARYVDGLVISGNIVDTGARVGVYQLLTLNSDTNGNFVRSTQQNGIYVYSPLEQCSIFDNTLTNVGAAGVDTAGASSGIFVEGDGGGTVEGNIIDGEPTQTKMLYGIQLGSGDKTQWAIQDNQIYDAEGAIISLHNLTNDPLRLFGGNIGTAASGIDALSGLATALPSRGNPKPDWWGTSAPVSGAWQQGSKVWRLYPDVGQYVGWVCASSGTPGTWIPFGPTQSANAYTVTNPTTDRALNVSGDSTAQVAAVLGTLIADLQSAGVLRT